MGCWGMGIAQSDDFCEFYDRFMELYDVGKDIAEIHRELLAEYERDFEPDDGVFHDAYFAIAKAQWMCGGVQPEILQKVEEIISSGANIEFMRELEATEADLKQRQRNLSKFLKQLQTPRPTVRQRRPPAKPRELPQMEPGDVFSYKVDKGVRVFIILGKQNLPIEWDSLPVCILRSNFPKAPDLSAILHEPVGIVCCIDTKAYPAKSKLKHLGRIALPEGLFVRWDKVPHPPLTAALDYCDYYHVNPRNILPEDYPLPIPSVVFLQSDCRKLFTRDFSDVIGNYFLHDLIYPGEFKMKITDTFDKIPYLFENGSFCMDKWEAYARTIHPDLADMCREDVREAISTGQVSWEENYLPVLNAVIADDAKREAAHASFLSAVKGLELKITAAFGRAPDVEIILYMGLCCGAGWVTELGDKTVVLLGLEKIMELNWHGMNSMLGLIYHELGHVYQAQFGVLESESDADREAFLWQLFTEGVAMVFEQEVSGQPDTFHQYDAKWKTWCEEHFTEILRDFDADLPTLTFATQRWFGDWVKYRGYGDVGYYLGCRFVRFILQKHTFDDILSFGIDQVEAAYQRFIAV